MMNQISICKLIKQQGKHGGKANIKQNINIIIIDIINTQNWNWKYSMDYNFRNKIQNFIKYKF